MLFLLVFYLISISQCSVYIGFPFNEQLPNVARVDEEYSFVLANLTYKSTNGTVSYSASNLPQWLSFDSSSRTFSGKPSTSDIGSFDITLTGTDSDSTVSKNYSMIVSNDTGLLLSSEDAMFTEIAKYGYTNGRDGLIVQPGDQFNIKFDTSVFKSYSTSERPIIAYYGRSADRSSLPNWISFNSDDLSFSGNVPYVTSEIAPSIEYGFSFIASDYYGFAGAEGIFKLIVGAHQLSTSLNETTKINGTLGSYININVPILSDVFLDGSTISRENISMVYAEDLPNYINFNSDNYTLTGQFPNSSTFDNFTIIVEDKYGNLVDMPYSLDAIGSVFTVEDLPNVNATRGEFFQYQLLQSLFTDYNKTKISVDYNATWVTYHQGNRTFTGISPKKLDKVAIQVKASSYYDTETKGFNIQGVSAKNTTSSSSSSSTKSSSSSSTSKSSSSAHPSPSSSSVTTNSSSSNNRKALAIGLGIGIPVCLLLIALTVLLCCCAKRRKRSTTASNADEDDERGNLPKSPELNGPGFGTTIHNDDHDKQAKQLASLNVLKLDGKIKDTSDAHSTSSSVTQVATHHSDDSRYFDASEKPIKSWRANDESDVKKDTSAALIKKQLRSSDASLSTVNTEQLFSVRLVDDQSFRNSNQSSLGSNQFLSNGSLNGLLSRDLSGNIQRLDSDGNIVETSGSSNQRPRISRSPSANLDILVEENSKDYSNNTMTQEDSTIYHSNELNISTNDDTESSSMLLSKFHNSHNISNSNSEQDISSYSHNSNNRLVDDFKATQNSNGEFKWIETTNDQKLISPGSDHFVFNDSPSTLNNSSNTPMRNSKVSVNSIASSTSDNILPNKQVEISNASLGNKKAKLVDFTRKGSLRKSACEPEYKYEGEIASIHYDDSD